MVAFDGEVRSSGRGSHAVVVPHAVVAELGSRRVRVTIGAQAFDSTLGSYGGRTFLGLRKSILAALGAAAGDVLHVDLEPGADDAPPPAAASAPPTSPELESAVTDDPALARAWQALPDGHREEYGRWVAAGEDTTARRSRIARLRHRLVPGA